VSKDPESVPFVQRVLQTLALPARASVSQTGERWFLLARHAAIVDRRAYSSLFTWVRQVLLNSYEENCRFFADYHRLLKTHKLAILLSFFVSCR